MNHFIVGNPTAGIMSPRQQAELEVANENRTRGVARLKVLIRQLEQAKTVVANFEREIADCEAAIAQGNLPV